MIVMGLITTITIFRNENNCVMHVIWTPKAGYTIACSLMLFSTCLVYGTREAVIPQLNMSEYLMFTDAQLSGMCNFKFHDLSYRDLDSPFTSYSPMHLIMIIAAIGCAYVRACVNNSRSISGLIKRHQV